MRSVFTVIAFSAALTCRVSIKIAESPAAVSPACSHPRTRCSVPATRQLRQNTPRLSLLDAWGRHAHGMVPSGARQNGAGARDPGVADWTEVAARQAAGRRARHSWPTARLWAEGRAGQQGPVRGTHP